MIKTTFGLAVAATWASIAAAAVTTYTKAVVSTTPDG
jgi:hypothetical protein